jgi:hypothetical protein
VAYLKVDDNAPWHPKQLKAGPLACWLWLCGLAYACRHATDGLLPAEAIPTLCPDAVAQAERLVDVGLWDRVEGGFRIHDFLDWNDSAAHRRAKMAEKTARQAKWREQRRDGRRTTGASPVDAPETHGRRATNAAPTPTPTPKREEALTRPQPLIARIDPNAAFTAPTFRVPRKWETDTIGQSNGRLDRPTLLKFYAAFQAWVEDEQPDLTGNALFRALDTRLAIWRDVQASNAEIEKGRKATRALMDFEARMRAEQKAGGAA